MTSQPFYRPDIDGLRAIAVLAVVIHHFAPAALPGGFVGVDIFFVISGYLITQQLLASLQSGKFSFADFYAKRIHRIVPALWLVVMACLLVGGLTLSPAEWVTLAKGAVAAVLGLSNIFFWQEYGNYFGGDAKSAMLLHTWSLGVEEQFYLLWPLVLWFLIKLPGRWLGWTLLLGVVCGVVFSQWAANRYASASYYLLPTRFFELLLGALLAWHLMQKNRISLTAPVTNLIAFLGLGLIGITLFRLNASAVFPGWNALLPTLGAALLILAGVRHHFFYSVLASEPFVHVGLISYALYLWHWPVVAWLNTQGIALKGWALWGGLGLSWALAELTLKYVERPMREFGGGVSLYRTLVFRFCPALLILLFAAGTVLWGSGFTKRFDVKVAQFEQALEQRPEKLRAGCHVPTALFATLPNPTECLLGASDNEVPSGVLWGDSYANHFSGMVDELSRHQGLTIMDYTMDACPPLVGYVPQGNVFYAQKCVKRNEQMLSFLQSSEIKHVVMAANWPVDNAADVAMQETLKVMGGMNIKVTLILANSTIKTAPKCSIRQAMMQSGDECAAVQQSQPEYVLKAAQSRDVYVLDPNRFICVEANCFPEREGVLLYRDSGHLNDVGSRWLGNKFLGEGYRL